MKKLLLFLCAIVVLASSCSEEIPPTPQEEDEELVLTAREQVESPLLFEVPYERQSLNKSTATVINGGEVTIDGQNFNTVIIGNQRWITSNYISEIYYDDGFEPWTTSEEFRGHAGNKGKDLPLFEQFKAKVSGCSRTRYFIYSLAMLLDEQLDSGDLVENDKLNPKYKTTGSWHIPSTKEEFELRDNLSNKDILINLAMSKSGFWYHHEKQEYDPKSNVLKSTMEKFFMAQTAHCHWNREYWPHVSGSAGPYGTWRITVAQLDGSLSILTGDFQDLEPIVPIRLVQRVALK